MSGVEQLADEVRKLMQNERVNPTNILIPSSSFAAVPTRFGIIEGSPEEIREQYDQFVETERSQQDMNIPFNRDLVMRDTESTNSYLLYNARRPFMPRELFDECLAVVRDNSSMDFTSFVSVCEKTMCSEWSKQDEHGESSAGFYRAPDNSFERENAYYLSRAKNILELFKLPWHTHILIRSVELGCASRLESVRYSNFVCEWLARKCTALGMDDSCLRREHVMLPDDFDEWRYLETACPTKRVVGRNTKKAL